jgi:hypothetical protein
VRGKHTAAMPRRKAFEPILFEIIVILVANGNGSQGIVFDFGIKRVDVASTEDIRPGLANRVLERPCILGQHRRP